HHSLPIYYFFLICQFFFPCNKNYHYISGFISCAYNDMTQYTFMFYFIICADVKLSGDSAYSFHHTISKFILNDTRFHIINNVVTPLTIKTSDQLSIFFPNTNMNVIAISPGIICANGFVYRNIWEMRYFFHYIFHLVLFHFQLHIITHMLYLTTTTFIKHIARWFHTMLTLLIQLNEFTKSKFLIHF